MGLERNQDAYHRTDNSHIWGQYSLDRYGLAAYLLPEVSRRATTITAFSSNKLPQCERGTPNQSAN